jgi:hypothetical protein
MLAAGSAIPSLRARVKGTCKNARQYAPPSSEYPRMRNSDVIDRCNTDTFEAK